MQPFTPLPSEQQRLGVPGATENKWGMTGHFPEPPQGCGRADAGSRGCLWGPEGGSRGLVDAALVTGRAGCLWRCVAGLAGEAASGALAAA